MKISKRLLPICFALALIFSGWSLINVAAQGGMNDQQIDRILTNCVSAKNTLNQLHASDALLRVNRGQIYESISTKLMSNFNDRVSSNNFNNSALSSISSNYNAALNTFRVNYKTYEEHLAFAIGIDCLKQPVSFYDAVALARSERSRVHDDIIKLNRFVDQYQLAVNQFEKDYLKNNSGASN